MGSISTVLIFFIFIPHKGHFSCEFQINKNKHDVQTV